MAKLRAGPGGRGAQRLQRPHPHLGRRPGDAPRPQAAIAIIDAGEAGLIGATAAAAALPPSPPALPRRRRRPAERPAAGGPAQ